MCVCDYISSSSSKTGLQHLSCHALNHVLYKNVHLQDKKTMHLLKKNAYIITLQKGIALIASPTVFFTMIHVQLQKVQGY